MDSKAARIGLIGSGHRGMGLAETASQMSELHISAICDKNRNNCEPTLKYFRDAGKSLPDFYDDYHELLTRKDIEGVIIATNWITHVEIARAAMKAGKYAGVEVGGAASLEECWQLVRASEETGIPCMLLENCCYDVKELTIFNIVKKGILGEIVHCECGYAHDLRNMAEHANNRLYNNMHRNGDLYPTHGIGPIAKILSINRGNRFVSLTSMASKSSGLNHWLKKNGNSGYELADFSFAKGDVAQSMIKCAHGETVLVTHNVSLPRPYSRCNVVQGTNGIYMEAIPGIFIDGQTQEDKWDSFEDCYIQYGHPLWKQFEKEGVKGGHGGMDYLILAAFADSVKTKAQPPIDVYDTATWMAITVLSEQSIALGSMPVPFPDFTSGKWIHREPVNKSKFALDDIFFELFE